MATKEELDRIFAGKGGAGKGADDEDDDPDPDADDDEDKPSADVPAEFSTAFDEWKDAADGGDTDEEKSAMYRMIEACKADHPGLMIAIGGKKKGR